MTSAAWPLQVAVVDALNADEGYTNILGGPQANPPGTERTFSGRAPQDIPGDYVTVGDTGERGLPAWAKSMKDGEVLIHIWTREVSNRAPLLVYAEMERILAGARLAINGHIQVRGALELVTVFPDQDLKRMHGVVRYTAATTKAEA